MKREEEICLLVHYPAAYKRPACAEPHCSQEPRIESRSLNLVVGIQVLSHYLLPSRVHWSAESGSHVLNQAGESEVMSSGMGCGADSLLTHCAKHACPRRNLFIYFLRFLSFKGRTINREGEPQRERYLMVSDSVAR